MDKDKIDILAELLGIATSPSTFWLIILLNSSLNIGFSGHVTNPPKPPTMPYSEMYGCTEGYTHMFKSDVTGVSHLCVRNDLVNYYVKKGWIIASY